MATITDELVIQIKVAQKEAESALKRIKSGIVSFNKEHSRLRSELGAGRASFKNSIFWILKLSAAYLSLRTIKETTTDMIWMRAKVDLLSNSLDHLAKNVGIGAEFLKLLEVQISSLGITTEDTLKIIGTFAKTGLDISNLAELARSAQDAAVISGKTTSETLSGIVNGIVTLQSRVLRTHGVFVNIKKVIIDYAKAHGVSSDALSLAEKQAAVFGATLENLANLQGSYTNSLKNTAKQVFQLDRLFKEAKLALGLFGQEALRVAVEDISLLLMRIQLLQKDGKLDEWGKNVSDSLVTVYETLRTSLKFIWDYGKAIIGIWAVMKGYTILLIVTERLVALNLAFIAISGQTLINFIITVGESIASIGLLSTAVVNLKFALVTLTGIGVIAWIAKVTFDFISSSEKIREVTAKTFGFLSKTWTNFHEGVERSSRERRERELSNISDRGKAFVKMNKRAVKLITDFTVGDIRKNAGTFANYVDNIIFSQQKLIKNTQMQKEMSDDLVKGRFTLMKKLGRLGLTTMEEFNKAVEKGDVVWDTSNKKWINLIIERQKATSVLIEVQEKGIETLRRESKKELTLIKGMVSSIGDYKKGVLELEKQSLSDVFSKDNLTLEKGVKGLEEYNKKLATVFETRRKLFDAIVKDIKTLPEKLADVELKKLSKEIITSAIEGKNLMLDSYRDFYSEINKLRTDNLKKEKDAIKDLFDFEKDVRKARADIEKIVEKFQPDELKKKKSAWENHTKTVRMLDEEFTRIVQLNGKKKAEALEEYIKTVEKLADEQESVKTGFPPEGIGIISDSAFVRITRAKELWDETTKKVSDHFKEVIQKSKEASEEITKFMLATEFVINKVIAQIRDLEEQLAALTFNEVIIDVVDNASPAINAIQEKLDGLNRRVSLERSSTGSLGLNTTPPLLAGGTSFQGGSDTNNVNNNTVNNTTAESDNRQFNINVESTQRNNIPFEDQSKFKKLVGYQKGFF